MFRRIFWILIVLLLACSPFSLARDKYVSTKKQTWSLASGGNIELRARFGDLRVVPTDDHVVSITYTMRSNHESFFRNVELDSQGNSSRVMLKLNAPHNGSVDVELKVPAQSDLFLRISAGDIKVGAVKGNKDIETHAGDIEIVLPEHSDLGLVDASTHAGDVTAPFGKPHGWIGGSLRYEGSGHYRLHAHTFAGDVQLREQETTSADSCPCPQK
jgi:hypothetical protein